MRDLVLSYLRAVFPPGSRGFFAVCSATPDKQRGMLSRHFAVTDLDAAAEYILAEDAAGRNTYLTLCAHGQDLGPYKRGTRAEKVSAAVLWVDIDRKGPGHAANDLPETIADVVDLLRGIQFEPSFIVDTGGGWHVYWALSAPLALDDKTRDEFQATARALHKQLGAASKARGWHMDNTSDITRVLRPAGSHNHKPGRDSAPLVDFIVKPGEGSSYDFRILQRAFTVQNDAVAKLFAGAQKVSPGVADPATTDAPVAEQQHEATGLEWDEERTRAEITDKIGRNRHADRTEALQAFLAGKTWARKGERDAMAQRLVSWLCFYTGGLGSINAIVEMAIPSLEVMDAECPPVTPEWFEEKVVRAMAEARRVCDERRKIEERIKERGFAVARGKFEETAHRAIGLKLPLGAPQDAALTALGGAAKASEPAGCAPTVSAPGGASEPMPPAPPAVAALFNKVLVPDSSTAVTASAEPPAGIGMVQASAGTDGVGADSIMAPVAPTIADMTQVTPSQGPTIQGSTALAIVPPAEPSTEEVPPAGLSYYTREELEAAAIDQGALSGLVCSLEDLKSRMIVQKAETFFMLKRDADGFWRYGHPVQRGELDVALTEDFRCLPEQVPAPDGEDAEPFFSWHALKADGGVRRKTVKEVLAELSTVARGEVIYDLRIPRSYYEPKSRAFFVAACPVKDLKPEFDPMIDAWLRTFGENESDRDKWLDFCATLTDLRYPTCGVFLSGPPDTGKTMFAKGAARLWAEDYTEMDNVFSSFNSGLSNCPLIVADEALPTDSTGRTVSTKLLRRLIGSDRRSLRRKYMSDATIIGAVRCLFLANNEDMIGQGDESLGADALEAVAGRFLHIRVTRAAHDYLVSIGGRSSGTKGWVDDNKIAKHLLWLRDNRAVKYGHRFIVDGHESKVSQLLATNGVIPGLVCEWLSRFLSKPREAMLRSGSVILGGGKFWINAQALLDSWSDLIKSERAAPTLSKINKALGGISYQRDSDREYVGGRRIRYWKIRPDVILQFAEANQIGDDSEAMRARIEGPEQVFEGTAVSAVFGNHEKGK